MAGTTAIILTAYNRPSLVRDAIASVHCQTTRDWNLYILDDGSDEETREAILASSRTAFVRSAAYGIDDVWVDAFRTFPPLSPAPRIVWWKGPDRPMFHRKASIPYSRSINLALNHLLADEKYVTYLCDDDQLYPESIQARADYLDAHSDVHVVFGLSRSVQYDASGEFNKWSGNVAPQPGRHYPRPTGRRVFRDSGGPLHYFADLNERDPETGLPYVEEAFWQEGPITYGHEGKTDHNQVMHRRECLTSCYPWPDGAELGGKEFWGEDLGWGVGDYAFFTLLGRAHKFYGIDAWCCTKKFHGLSDGVSRAERRE